MKSVLDRLRDEDRGAVLALTAAERVALALALGDRISRHLGARAGCPASTRPASSTARSSMVAGPRPVWPSSSGDSARVGGCHAPRTRNTLRADRRRG